LEAEAPAASPDTSTAKEEAPRTVDESPGGDESVRAAIEAERQRLARSLNDGPLQVLSNIVLRAEAVERLIDSDPARARAEAQRVHEAAVAALANVRLFMFDMYPSVLDDLGLVTTLRRYVQAKNDASQLAIDVRVDGQERRLPHEAELGLFRAAQEGLLKAEGQPDVHTATLRVSFLPDSVELEFAAEGGKAVTTGIFA